MVLYSVMDEKFNQIEEKLCDEQEPSDVSVVEGADRHWRWIITKTEATSVGRPALSQQSNFLVIGCCDVLPPQKVVPPH